MKVDYAGLGTQSAEPFWRFIGCCLVSKPEILGSGPNLSDLTINFDINGESVDLLRAWQLFHQPQPPQQATTYVPEAPATSGPSVMDAEALQSLKEKIEALMNSFGSQLSYIENGVNDAVSYASDAAADAASEHARESVNDSFWSNAPNLDECDSEVNELHSDIIDMIDSVL